MGGASNVYDGHACGIGFNNPISTGWASSFSDNPSGADNGLSIGTGDGENQSTCNLQIRSWNGLAFVDNNAGKNNIWFGCRTSKINSTGPATLYSTDTGYGHLTIGSSSSGLTTQLQITAGYKGSGTMSSGTTTYKISGSGTHYFNDNLEVSGTLKATGTTTLSSVIISSNLTVAGTNGAVVIAGGVGIAKNLNVDGQFSATVTSHLSYVNADWVKFSSSTGDGLNFIGGAKITGSVNTLSSVSTQITFSTGLSSSLMPFIMVSLDDGASNNNPYTGYLTAYANRTSWNGSTWTSYINVYNNFDSNIYNGYPHNTTSFGVSYMAYQFTFTNINISY